MTTPDPTPTDKVTAAGAGGASATLIVYLLEQFVHLDIPATATAALATLLALAAGYIKSERRAAA